MLGGWVRESCCLSTQSLKGAAFVEVGPVVCQVGCQRLKSPASRYGEVVAVDGRRAVSPWCSSIDPVGALYMLTSRMDCCEEDTEMASRSQQGGPMGTCAAESWGCLRI